MLVTGLRRVGPTKNSRCGTWSDRGCSGVGRPSVNQPEPLTTRVDSEAHESASDTTFVGARPGRLSVKDIGRLLLRCADRPGLVAAVSTFLSSAGANIISLDQHSTEQTGGIFMQRTVFHLPGLTAARDSLAREFAEQVAVKFDMDFRLTEAAKPKRVAVMASKEDQPVQPVRQRRLLARPA